MNGLEKIISKILSEAEAEAAVKRDAAKTEAEAITKAAKTEASQVMTNAAAASKAECATIRATAASSSASQKRALLLKTKADAVDDAYTAALNALVELPEESYSDLLCDLLYSAIRERVRAAKEILELYGEDEEGEVSDSYVVMFNAADRDKYGKAVVKALRRRTETENASEEIQNAAKSLKLSAKAAKIEGGLILIDGSVETNCSLSLLINRLRDSIDTEVYGVLFGKSGAASIN